MYHLKKNQWNILLLDKRQAISILLTLIMVSGMIFGNQTAVLAYTQKSGYVTGDNVNVRSGAGTTHSAITKLSTGHEVTVISEATAASNGAVWYRIHFLMNGNQMEGYMHSDYVRIVLPNVTPEDDPDYENYLEAQQFPESYRASLRALHKLHPTWIFVAMPTGLDWQEVVSAQTKLGTNLISVSSITSWKSLEEGAIDWTTGIWKGMDTASWVAASEGIIRYYLDPRNFLNEDSRILQFETLRYIEGEQTVEGLANILSDTLMANDNYYRIFMEAGQQTGVNPYHLASRCKQEVGSNGSNSTYDKKDSAYSEFDGYYNYFNIGASPSAEHNSMYNGLARAKAEGWDTPEKSIRGGAAFLGERYIKRGQDTLYLQKFDVVDGGDGLYSHQYMTNLQAAASEAIIMKKAYPSLDEATVTYSIPVYVNMPDKRATQPEDNGSPYSVLSSLTVEGYSFTERFNGYQADYIIEAKTEAETVVIGAKAYAPGAQITGTGTIPLTEGMNTLQVVSTGNDGSSRTYRIQIERTGQRPFILGDVDYSGKITAADALQVLRFVAELDSSNEEQQMLCDTNRNGVTDAGDALLILKYVVGKITEF